ncbi:CapA family protein [Treponema sp. HNW]|uniref:CapA family protein n=1 Tax=Treponema sp. HNW TaxID=3116654 RepID=UPI003D0D14B2
MAKLLYLISVLCSFLIFSCASVHENLQNEPAANTQTTVSTKAERKNPPKQEPLKLCFAGDIMAHNVNFRMKDYSLIYRDVKTLLNSKDLAFANLETPICDELPYQTFPNFNIHGEYAQAAIDAGFNVFSLANNHTNDQGTEGIRGSADFFAKARSQGVYSAGIKKPGSDELTYELIEVQGWKILFAAVTEIVNFNRHNDLFDFYPFTEKGKLTLKNELIRLQKENPCDVFILSVHSADPEYVLEVTSERREYFYSLLDLGVDIIWANHSHVSKPWERVSCKVTEDGTNRKTEKLIMYGMGNTISGQNIPINFENPAHPYEYTGTGILLQVDLKQEENTAESGFGGRPLLKIADIEPEIIVTHVDKGYNFVIRRLNENLIAQQDKRLAAYYKKRLELMKNIREITTCR